MIIIISLISISHTDEIGISTGINSSYYLGWNRENIEYQKTSLFNPFEIFYEKSFSKNFGLYSAVQYSCKSIFGEINATTIDGTGAPVQGGILEYEKRLNYLSVLSGPTIFHYSNHFKIDARVGFKGDIYINEWENIFDSDTIIGRNKNTRSFVLCFMGGVGIGYLLNDKFNIGLRSSLSRTITDVFSDQNLKANIHFVNWENVFFVSMNL